MWASEKDTVVLVCAVAAMFIAIPSELGSALLQPSVNCKGQSGHYFHWKLSVDSLHVMKQKEAAQNCFFKGMTF